MTKPTPEQVEEIARKLLQDQMGGRVTWARASPKLRDIYRAEARLFMAEAAIKAAKVHP